MLTVVEDLVRHIRVLTGAKTDSFSFKIYHARFEEALRAMVLAVLRSNNRTATIGARMISS